MLNEQTQPMTAEEGKNRVNIYRFAEAYHAYRLAFEKQQQQPSDPYWSDPATWPEWANWTAVNKDGEMCFYALEPYVVKHNPDWRNSLRSREEVSRWK